MYLHGRSATFADLVFPHVSAIALMRGEDHCLRVWYLMRGKSLHAYCLLDNAIIRIRVKTWGGSWNLDFGVK